MLVIFPLIYLPLVLAGYVLLGVMYLFALALIPVMWVFGQVLGLVVSAVCWPFRRFRTA